MLDCRRCLGGYLGHNPSGAATEIPMNGGAKEIEMI